jgi:signal transduction histidine kinase
MLLTLRTRLIVAVVVATLLPVVATVWVASLLLDRSLSYSSTADLERLSRTFEETARRFYQLERDTLRRDSLVEGRTSPARFTAADVESWPDAVRDFWESGDSERFTAAGPGGDHLELMRRSAQGVDVFRRELGGIRMDAVTAEVARTREILGTARTRDLRRGLTLTLVLLIAGVWVASLAPLIFVAHRISRPIQHLTAGLTDFAAGDWDRRVDARRDDEVGRAIGAFNRMAAQLRQDRERLVYLTQMTSWQLLARKTAHELKNSLTPIRLTIEEMVARQPAHDRAFAEQAAQIVISEIETLERRVRAFSELAAEPAVRLTAISVNALVLERLSLLKAGHPGTTYETRLDPGDPQAQADADLVKGILTNLLENAAEAAGPGGTVSAVTRSDPDGVIIEVHDSGPGLSHEAAATLFEPSITFKKRGMGLGLSIARKNALLNGGDITLIEGELGGAGFRIVLRPATSEITQMIT